MEALISILAVTVVIAALILGFYASLQRQKKLAAWALSKGLTITFDKSHTFDCKFPNFKCLHQGNNRYAHNIMQGTIAGREFIVCDYHYETGSGKSKTSHSFSMTIAKSPILLEPLFIRPENFFDKFTEFAGFNDIDFESAEFSRKFFVKSPDKKWAYDIIHPQMMEFLLASPPFSIQFDLVFVIVYSNRLFSPEDFDAAVNLTNGIFQRIPDYVIQNQKLRLK